jgi:glycosyltransferase involved in cell wall biosynthesis
MKISIIHPSRNRPKQAFETASHWLSNVSSNFNLSEYILSVDNDDKYLEEYKQYFDKKFKIVISDNQSLVEAANSGAKECSGNILVLVSDDFECYQGWDVDLVNHYTQNKNNVLKTNDGIEEWIVTLPIMDKEYYNNCGYIYYPEYKHMFCDTEMTHRAELEKKLFRRMDLTFKHKHYTTGDTKKDEINEKANLTWEYGEKIYLDRVKKCFGIENVNYLDISSTSAINWIKNKIK